MVDERPIGPVEGPAFEVYDPRFEPLIDRGAQVVRLWTGSRWTEGPAWVARDKALIWSDIPGDQLLRWDEATGEISTWRKPALAPNGNTTDRQGRLVTCEQKLHRIGRTEFDGTVTPLVDSIGGLRLNSPNDVVVKSDDTIWFSDPSYGREGEGGVTGKHVYRWDPRTSEIRQMTADFVMPNGLAFSPDESLLYIIDTGSTHQKPDGPNHVRRFRVATDGSLSGGEVLAKSEAQNFDGLRIDTEGNLWMGDADGIHVYDPDGVLLGKLKVPERCSNLAFGGTERNILFMTGTTSLYACHVRARPCL